MLDNTKIQDKTEQFHNALIQHGPLSQRIYLMKVKQADPVKLIIAMEQLAQNKGYTKIFAKVPADQADLFLKSDYNKEAVIPGFYAGQQSALLLGRYLNPDRKIEKDLEDIEKIIELAHTKTNQPINDKPLPNGAIVRKCTTDDAEEMSGIYKTVFKSYPFPIDDPQYISKTMADNFVYFGVEINKKLVALSSAEMDTKFKNVEMTDFATLPELTGKGFASKLLEEMENEMRRRQIKTAYTIARAISPGMNITFAKAGYTYSGRLINNTNIAGQIESMNIWHKKIHKHHSNLQNPTKKP